MNILIETIVSKEDHLRNRSFESLLQDKSTSEIITLFDELEIFRKKTTSLYHKVRSCIYLYAGFDHLVNFGTNVQQDGLLPYKGYTQFLDRNFEEAIALFRKKLNDEGPNISILSGLSKVYHALSFEYLTSQVRKSVRSSVGNQWMFRGGHLDEHSIRIHPHLVQKEDNSLLYPILKETTPVRLDLSHSSWSDIFFLGMDYPDGANVINISVDLGVYNRDSEISPPCQAFVRVINDPVIRLTSIDLDITKDITSLDDLFNFGNDYFSLLKAGIIAAGFIPPSFESTNQSLKSILTTIIGNNLGLELVTKVNNIPKGSRLAVSTNLLASIISAVMRATKQTQNLEGDLNENERRLVASRAILGEWLGGSGGGWQDSGGVWPGIKHIHGEEAKEGDPEYGISKGCLLPRHELLTAEKLNNSLYEDFSKSLILFHGGMAQNVGPILEMVSERYLLRSSEEWKARKVGNDLFNNILNALELGDVKQLAQLIHKNWEGPLKSIIPWVSNHYTETIIKKVKDRLGDDFYGFQMLGGMSGGGMGIYVNPSIKEEFKSEFAQLLVETKRDMEDALPFAMDPVIYDFNINQKGTQSSLLKANSALMPDEYYKLQIASLVEKDISGLSKLRKAEFDYYTQICDNKDIQYNLLRTLVSSVFKVTDGASRDSAVEENVKTDTIKKANGFDNTQHESLRSALIKGRIGLERNRLAYDTVIKDVSNKDFYPKSNNENYKHIGDKMLKNNEIGIITLAAGVGSRWTKGAGVIKAVNPFIEIDQQYRSFIEIHLLKSQKTNNAYNVKTPHIFATGHLTHNTIKRYLDKNKNYNYDGPVYLSPGKSIGQRFIPMERDLHFLWEELNEEVLDEQKQKVRDDIRKALINWAKEKGEGNDYVDNIAEQRLNPMGHWYEVSNMLRNGTLVQILKENPQLTTLMLHNIDTLGASLDAEMIGYHKSQNHALTFEVIPRVIDDRGGGLAKINDKVKLIEGLAQPNEEDEFKLRYYNTQTTWINIDKLLKLFGLSRNTLSLVSPEEIDKKVRDLALKIPTYVTIKDVKYRWGHGQEDIYPVAQMEKLWSDMTSLNNLEVGFASVSRMRGQQLKDPAQLDNWIKNGSKSYISNLIL